MHDILKSAMLDTLVEEHQNDLLEEAKKSSALKDAGGKSSKLQERFLVSVGDLLISTGTRLRERYKPAVPPCPSPEACQPG